MKIPCIFLWCVSLSVAAAAPPGEKSFAVLGEFLDSFCLDCHDAETEKGGVNLEPFTDIPSLYRDLNLWERVLVQVEDENMPPPKKKHQPEAAKRQQAVTWLKEFQASLDFSHIPWNPGRVEPRRLNRLEYNNSLRDLLQITYNPANRFPADGAGGEGFDNTAATLFLPPLLLEKMVNAADQAVRSAFTNPKVLAQWRIEDLSGGADPAAQAEALAKGFLFAAFRRPVDPDELARYLGLYTNVVSGGAPHAEGLQRMLAAALVSPSFLFRSEPEPAGTAPERIDDFAWASRMSYFLWASTPDAPLLEAARAGQLGTPAQRKSHVLRYIADERVRDALRSFSHQWLGLTPLESTHEPDGKVFPEWTENLRDAMLEEPTRTMTYVVQANRPVRELFDADYVFVNGTLAKHYGITDRNDPDWVRVPIAPADAPEWALGPVGQRTGLHERGGILTMPAVLTTSSYDYRTSPVLRGKWVMETLLDLPPPAAPADVGEIGQNAEGEPEIKAASLREQLEVHRAKPECAACHKRMDPIGFGLDGYDALGRWRGRGVPLAHYRGDFPDGTTFSGVNELREVLLEDEARLMRALTRRMLGFALGRALTWQDRPAVETILEKTRAAGGSAQAWLLAIVESDPFCYRAPAAMHAENSP